MGQCWMWCICGGNRNGNEGRITNFDQKNIKMNIIEDGYILTCTHRELKETSYIGIFNVLNGQRNTHRVKYSKIRDPVKYSKKRYPIFFYEIVHKRYLLNIFSFLCPLNKIILHEIKFLFRVFPQTSKCYPYPMRPKKTP